MRAALPLAAPLLALEATLKGKRRPPLGERLGWRLPPAAAGGLWLQAVSVGEVEVARALTARLRELRPGLPLTVTATTSTGLDLARRTLGGEATVWPCPLDLSRPLRRLLDRLDPRTVILVETELWPELLHQAGRRGVPVAVVNARLSESSFARYRRLRRLLRPLLAPLSLVLARAESDAARFAALGVPEERIVVAGNVKYDLEPDPRPLAWEAAATEMAAGRPIVVAGSTMEGEERLVLDAVATLRAGRCEPFLILAPRHPERADSVARLVEEHGLALARRSRLDRALSRTDVLLIDTIGELGRAYRVGRAAFVGGSLVPTGGHNPLEPAVWGVPVVCGPHLFNFREVYDELVAVGGATVVDRVEELAASLGEWVRDSAAAATAGAAARRVVEANRGATGRIVDDLLALGRL